MPSHRDTSKRSACRCAQGRAFTRDDGEGGPPVAIVNDELARQLWRDRTPLGETVRIGTTEERGPVLTVVGVVATVRRSPMHDTPVARMYVPYAQYPNSALSVVVRTRDRTGAALSQFTQAVEQTDPDLFVEGLRTVEADVAQFLAPVRMMASLLGAFGVAGVLLAGLGVFGTVSYTVSQREGEMAVRAALGATRRDIVQLVVGSTLRMTAAGMIIGAIAAPIAARMLTGVLFGVGPADAVSWATVALALWVVSLGACWRPALRASRMDPMALLRRP
jgi:putative ABC transport system permease protein